jgi:hypothetical protein
MLPLNAGANLVLLHGLRPVPAFGPTAAGPSSLLVACAVPAALLQAAMVPRRGACAMTNRGAAASAASTSATGSPRSQRSAARPAV